jgi:hypothetical protein
MKKLTFAFLVAAGAVSAQPIIDPSRTTTWQPGVTYNIFPGTITTGIPPRTTICTTLSPLGGIQDDTTQINNALANCPANQVVKLNAGTFNIYGNGIGFGTSIVQTGGRATNVTLRGSGTGGPCPAGNGGTGVTCGSGGTILRKFDRDVPQAQAGGWFPSTSFAVGAIIANAPPSSPGNVYRCITAGVSAATGGPTGTSADIVDGTVHWAFVVPADAVHGVLYVGANLGAGYTNSINLASNAVKETNSLTLVSPPTGYSGGDLVLIDHVTTTDPSAYWGPNHDPAGTTLNTATPAAGGSLAAGTYFYTVSATTAFPGDAVGTVRGLAVASNELSAVVNGTTNKSVTLSWTAVTPTDQETIFYRVYRGTTTGGENVFYDGITGTSFTDTGATGCPPAACLGTPPAGSSRNWFVRQGRSLSQLMRITGITGNTVTFETKFHTTFQTQYAAQMSKLADPPLFGVGIEDLYIYGGLGGDGNGNLAMSSCAYCWVKNVEAHWSVGSNIGFYGTYRSELRDSYIHETPDPNPGGAGYMTTMTSGAAENLFENNIMWFGNKTITMRGTGGGNVIAYNYMDDAFGSTYPHSPEAGLNAGHYTTPHLELLEGNRAFNFQGDSYWGNSLYITVFRNHLTGLRGHIGSYLTNYTTNQGGIIYPYGDYEGRAPTRIAAHSDNHNLVGNVLGFQGQTLLSYTSPTYNVTQSAFQFEALTSDPSAGCPGACLVPMWTVGGTACQGAPCAAWVPTTVNTLQRDGNWDFSTNSQTWCGVGGSPAFNPNPPPGPGTHVCNIAPQTIPNSLYLTAAPTFFSGFTWPWVQPESPTNPAKVFTLPAKSRFDAMPH